MQPAARLLLSNLKLNKRKMIFQFAIVLAVAWVTAANPLAVYSRQSTNAECADLPTRCSDALENYTQIGRPGENTNPSGIANVTQTSLGVLCSSECLGPFLRCAVTQSGRDLILQVICARDDHENFCLSKVIREAARGLSIIPPSICTSTCSEVTHGHAVPEFSSPTTKWTRMLRRNFVYQQSRQYTIAGLDWWTGPVDWTGGLTFELILGVLRNSLIIHVMELLIFAASSSTTAKDYNNALHGQLKLCKLQGGWLEES